MSALFLSCPWRGPLVDATEAGFTQGNRQAAAFFYSGILAASVVVVASGEDRITLGTVDSMLITPNPGLGGRGSW